MYMTHIIVRNGTYIWHNEHISTDQLVYIAHSMWNGTYIWHISIVLTSIRGSALYEWGVNWRTYRDRGTCTPGLVPYNSI